MFCEKYRTDVDRYVFMTGRPALVCVLLSQGLWVMAEHRYSHWVWKSVRVPVVRQLLTLAGMAWPIA